MFCLLSALFSDSYTPKKQGKGSIFVKKLLWMLILMVLLALLSALPSAALAATINPDDTAGGVTVSFLSGSADYDDSVTAHPIITLTSAGAGSTLYPER